MGKQRKYIVVTGGVLSGLGKGVCAASIGMFFSDEYRVVPMKLDNYLNVDPGTMNPIEHGEVFVLEDGKEVDMDFGHYERFLGTSCYGFQNLTMGKVFQVIRQKERRGDYLGKTVQMIPHVTNLIKDKIQEVGERLDADIVLIEAGGTVGDIEMEMHLEALRQLKLDVGRENVCYIHLSYVPIPYGVNEQKSKPTQQSVSLLKNKGINPDFIACRCENPLTEHVKSKIALFANLEKEDVFSIEDVDCIYKIPRILNEQDLIARLCMKLDLHTPSMFKFDIWEELLSRKKEESIVLTIAGKYTDLEDSYASVVEAINHCSFNFGVNIEIKWLDTENVNYELLSLSDAVIVPGGFGSRGIEGKIDVIRYVRENNIPYLGICYGMQLAIIEFLRNVCKICDATSLEVDENARSPVITIMDEQREISKKGGTMRLGAYNAVLGDGIIKNLYDELGLFKDVSGKFVVSERHRHRYEVNPEYVNIFEKEGLRVSGISLERDLVEFVELDLSKHPYFVATQAHPELKSKLEKPAPLFYGLIRAAMQKKSENALLRPIV